MGGVYGYLHRSESSPGFTACFTQFYAFPVLRVIHVLRVLSVLRNSQFYMFYVNQARRAVH